MSAQYVTSDAPTRCAKCKAKMTYFGGEWVHARIQDFFECNEVKATPNPYRSQT